MAKVPSSPARQHMSPSEKRADDAIQRYLEMPKRMQGRIDEVQRQYREDLPRAAAFARENPYDKNMIAGWRQQVDRSASEWGSLSSNLNILKGERARVKLQAAQERAKPMRTSTPEAYYAPGVQGRVQQVGDFFRTAITGKTACLSDLWLLEKEASEAIPAEDLQAAADIMVGWSLAEKHFDLEKSALVAPSIGARAGRKLSKKVLEALGWLSGGDPVKASLIAGAVPAVAVGGAGGFAMGRMSKSGEEFFDAPGTVARQPPAGGLAGIRAPAAMRMPGLRMPAFGTPSPMSSWRPRVSDASSPSMQPSAPAPRPAGLLPGMTGRVAPAASGAPMMPSPRASGPQAPGGTARHGLGLAPMAGPAAPRAAGAILPGMTGRVTPAAPGAPMMPSPRASNSQAPGGPTGSIPSPRPSGALSGRLPPSSPRPMGALSGRLPMSKSSDDKTAQSPEGHGPKPAGALTSLPASSMARFSESTGLPLREPVARAIGGEGRSRIAAPVASGPSSPKTSGPMSMGAIPPVSPRSGDAGPGAPKAVGRVPLGPATSPNPLGPVVKRGSAAIDIARAVMKSPVARTLVAAGGAGGAAGVAGYQLGEESGAQQEKVRAEEEALEQKRESLRQRILAMLQRGGYGGGE